MTPSCTFPATTPVIAAKCGFKADPDPFTFKVPGNILGVSDALLDTFPNGDPKSIIIRSVAANCWKRRAYLVLTFPKNVGTTPHVG
jgi:hypothetical protein